MGDSPAGKSSNKKARGGVGGGDGGSGGKGGVTSDGGIVSDKSLKPKIPGESAAGLPSGVGPRL